MAIADDAAAVQYDPQLYAKLHRGTPGDVAFYLDAVRSAREVLELGCGYGRILTELIRAGHHVTGLDIDPGMLTLIETVRNSLTVEQAARLTLTQGDMREFKLDSQYERVIIPYNGLYCLLSEAAAIDCLRCAGAHLSATGQVIFDAYAIDDFHMDTDADEFNNALDEQEDEEPIESVHWQGKAYDVFETCTWDKPGQQLQVSYRHVPRDDSATIVHSISHRYLLTSQVEPICKQAGLQIVELHQDFTGTALDFGAEHMVCIARKA